MPDYPCSTHRQGKSSPRVAQVPAGQNQPFRGLRALEELLGRTGLADMLIMAMEDGAARVQRMRAGHGAGDLQVVADEAHGLRGGASHLGADALCAACRVLELACAHPDKTALLESLARVEQAFAAYHAGLAAHRELLLRSASAG